MQVTMPPNKNSRPNRKYNTPHTRHRLHASLAACLLACMTGVVEEGFQMKLLPALQLVEHGTEPKVDGKAMWDCTQTAADCYKAILHFLGLHMLRDCCYEGKGSRPIPAGLDHFSRPQTEGSTKNMHDTTSHMPSKQAFPKGIPCSKHTGDSFWYTKVRLGKTKDGEVVKVCAHVLIATARYGVPDSHFDKDVPRSEVHEALHESGCSRCNGGCNNPLHIRWGFSRDNHEDRQIKKQSKKGPKAQRLQAARHGVQHASPTAPAQPATTRVTRSQARAVGG